MICPITGIECLRKRCKQYIPTGKLHQCKMRWLYEKAKGLEDLSGLITDVIKVTNPYPYADDAS